MVDVAGSIHGSIVENITAYLFKAAVRPLGYLLHYNDYIEKSKSLAKKLSGLRDRVQEDIAIARGNGETIRDAVQNWIAEVDKISAKAERFFEEEDKASKGRLKGWCTNLKQRYHFSKEAKHIALTISMLQDDGNFQNVSYLTPLGIISSYNGVSGILESRKSIIMKIMEALEDEGISKIGICGPGGVGKTTLVKEIERQAREDNLYDAVVMAVVSQTPSINKIQGETAHMLGFMKFSDNVELSRARSLYNRIKQEKRILVILDDIWGRINLDVIGIPDGKDHRGCKIVLTSRSKNVCDQMDCPKIFVVEYLTEEESWNHFKGLAGPTVENFEINQVAREIATKCGGLPVAIATIATALKNKNKHVWNDVARQLKKSLPTSIEGMQESVISSLKFSYNYLETEAKSMFLFCSLFPQDFGIPVEVIVRYGIALRWFSNVYTIDDARDRAHRVVSTLTSSFLLIYEIYEDKEYVKMHDVVRDFALTISPQHNNIFLVKDGTRLGEWPNRDTFEHLSVISLISNAIKDVPDGLQCHMLQALLLQKNRGLVIPDNFFQGMKNLKILDLSDTDITRLPESLSLLVNLRTLYLDNCKLCEFYVVGELVT